MSAKGSARGPVMYEQPEPVPGDYPYTYPRGPVAAMFNSPGPCYGLPGLVGQPKHDPRSVHYRGPAYPFGIRHGKFRDDCSPGPCYRPEPKMFRDGADGTPHYSLYSRPRDLSTHKTPGPGAYSPEHSGPTAHYRHAAYSFGSRTKGRKSDNSPGPNAYSLDQMLGKTVRSPKRQAPCYSMTGRNKVGSFCQDLAGSPGPGNYNTTDPSLYKRKSPGYSMTGRNTMPGDGTRKPGPGAHSPERVYVNKRQAPVCSFGIRHSQFTAPLIVQDAC